MTFLWPQALWFLLAVPVLLLVYALLLARRRHAALRYASLATVRDAAAAGGMRRHIPPLLFLLSFTALILAVARPTSVVMLPSHDQSVILAMDVSGSMRATDVAPDRLQAAQGAAKAFVQELPQGTRVGVVSFAATAAVVQPPTRTREDVLTAIDRFQLQRGTAIGSGIVVSLATIFPEAGIEVGDLDQKPEGTGAPEPVKTPDAKPKAPHTPVPPGSYLSSAIILLSDGQRTTGPDPIQAAKLAADRGVRVYTVGLGTTAGQVIGFEGWSMRVRLDEETLKEIARVTHGEYFYAGNAEDLQKVYRSLSSRMTMTREETEVSALFAALGAGLALVSALLSLLWFNRIL